MSEKIDYEAIKAQAKNIGECWDMVDHGAMAGAFFQEKVIKLAELCGLKVVPVGKKSR